MNTPIRVLCAGAGHMGRSHALAYHNIPDFEICGIVTRSPKNHSELGPDGKFTKSDEIILLDDEPDHDGLCQREQQYFLKAIRENLDLSDPMEDALSSMRIVAAADESFRTGKTIDL